MPKQDSPVPRDDDSLRNAQLDQGLTESTSAKPACDDITEKDIAIARARLASPGRFYTIDEVLAHLESLGRGD